MQDAVAQVRDPVLEVADRWLEATHELELDVLGGQVVEQSPALAEQDRDEVKLELVELPGADQRLCDPAPCTRHIAIAGRPTGERGAVRASVT